MWSKYLRFILVVWCVCCGNPATEKHTDRQLQNDVRPELCWNEFRRIYTCCVSSTISTNQHQWNRQQTLCVWSGLELTNESWSFVAFLFVFFAGRPDGRSKLSYDLHNVHLEPCDVLIFVREQTIWSARMSDRLTHWLAGWLAVCWLFFKKNT